VRKAAQNAAKRSRWGNESDASSKEDVDSDFSAAAGSPTDSEVSTDPQASDSEFDSVSSEQESDEEGNMSQSTTHYFQVFNNNENYYFFI
jgi:hypothetical protein